MIMEDPDWLEMVRKKAIIQGKTIREMILIDAGYMTSLQIHYYRSKILKDPAWLNLVRQKAIIKNTARRDDRERC